jgi:hypothetical protein
VSTWSNTPFQLDAENVALSIHTTEFQDPNGNIDMRERVPVGQPISNSVTPQNMIRAWGLLNVETVSISATETQVKGAILCGMNVAGQPIYIGNGHDNLWKIPLLTRLLRFRNEKYTFVPDAVVVGTKFTEGTPTDEAYEPKVRLDDDGKVTFVTIRGPSIPASGSIAPIERPFAYSFVVIGSAVDEALPAADALLGDGFHTATASPSRPDSGYAHEFVPVRPPPRPVTTTPDIVTPAPAAPTGPGSSLAPGLRGAADSTDLDDNSADPYPPGWRPPGSPGGLVPNRGRGRPGG